MRNYKWIEELAEQYESPDEIPVGDIADLAKIVGIESAIKVFQFFDGIPQFFPKKNIIEMQKEYIRHCSAGQSDVKLAVKFSCTLRHIQYIMSEPIKPSTTQKKPGYIAMFPEFEGEE